MRRLLLVFVLALIAAGAFAALKPQAARQLVVRLFGPPQVEMQEAYANVGSGATFDHSSWDAQVKTFVDSTGFIDYAAWGEDTTALDAYLEDLAAAPFDELGRDEKLAFLINAYNAFTIRLILDNLPVASIKDIPDADRWDAVRWNIGGNVYSLNQIEHEQVRPMFTEPRIHFGLVCAAVGCPPLRNEAFVAERLEEQLEDQTRFVHTHDTWYTFDADANRVELTSLYEWYGGDFVQVAGSVLEYLARYDAALAGALERGETPEIGWLYYDWDLNSTENREER